MMENREELNLLFDIYKELLTLTEQETFIDYFVEDLSFQEIADNRNITKSSVGKTIKSATQKLKNYESKLQILERQKKIKEVLIEEDIKILKAKINQIINY